MNESNKAELKQILAYKAPKGTIIKKVLAGSHAYGLSHENSDLDVRGIYVLPPAAFLGFTDPGLELEPGEFKDTKFFELKKFMSLCMKGNPSQLEILFSPNLIKGGVEEFLVYTLNMNRDCLIGKKAIKSAYVGFIEGEKNAANKDENEARRLKRWKHIFRLSFQAIDLLESGKLSVELSEADKKDIFYYTQPGTCSKNELNIMAENRIQIIKRLYETSNLPEEADAQKAEEIMRFIRNHVW
jgi:predicted nucleotidyltransferase